MNLVGTLGCFHSWYPRVPGCMTMEERMPSLSRWGKPRRRAGPLQRSSSATPRRQSGAWLLCKHLLSSVVTRGWVEHMDDLAEDIFL